MSTSTTPAPATEWPNYNHYPLVIGEDVRGITPDGQDVVVGELTAFILNEPGIAIPTALAPSPPSTASA